MAPVDDRHATLGDAGDDLHSGGGRERPADEGVQVGGVSGQGLPQGRSPPGGYRPAENSAGPTHNCTEAQRWRIGPARENAPDMAFEDELGLLGFRPAQEKRDGTRTFSWPATATSPTALHLPADDSDGPVHLGVRHRRVRWTSTGSGSGANEPLNQFLFPQVDTEVAQDMAEIAKAMERTEAMFDGMNFGHRG